jgi:phosphate transport system protein
MFKELLNLWRKQDLSKQLIQKSLETLRTDYKMFKDSYHCLRQCDDASLIEEIYKSDKLINKSERAIRRNVLTHLLMFDKAEIPAGLTLVSIVIDMERIGDYTKNIADLARLHPKLLHAGKYEEIIISIEQRIDDFFRLTLEAFPISDASLARKVVTEYRNVSRDCTLTTEFLIKGEGEFNVSDAVTLGLYLRFLKRIAAHLYNICTSIVNPFHRIGFSEKKKKD